MITRYSHCRFPMWKDDEPPTHVYCNMKTAPGFPYCDVHAHKCYAGMGPKPEVQPQSQETPK